MFFILSRVWDKEKILSPHEDLNLRPLDLDPLNFQKVALCFFNDMLDIINMI